MRACGPPRWTPRCARSTPRCRGGDRQRGARVQVRHHAVRRGEELRVGAGRSKLRDRGADGHQDGRHPVGVTVMDYSRLFRLDGRRVVVVGAGSGMGRAAAEALAAHGAEVICADRDEAAAKGTALSAGANASAIALDVIDSAAVERVASDLGQSTPWSSRRQPTYASACRLHRGGVRPRVGLNLHASFVLIRAFGSRMAGGRHRQHRGLLVHQGRHGRTRPGRVRRNQGGSRAADRDGGVRVRSSRRAGERHPTGSRRDAADCPAEGRRGVVDAYAQKTALGRWAQPEEVAGAVVYLAGDASSYVTGA